MATLVDIETEERACVSQLQQWLETEATFYGRKSEDFLIIFVRGCKLNMEKAKKKLHMYYENRKKIPQWWANRDVSELKPIFQLSIATVLSDNDPSLPTIVIHKLSRAHSVHFDNYIKMYTICIDIVLRRRNCQKNGVIVFVDCSDFPLWMVQKALSPLTGYNLIHGFYMAMPILLKGFHFFNFPLVGLAWWRLVKPLLPSKIKSRFFFQGSDLNRLKDNIDTRLLPEEYGGQNGRLVDHEETYLKEVSSYSDYILDDNKYGFH